MYFESGQKKYLADITGIAKLTNIVKLRLSSFLLAFWFNAMVSRRPTFCCAMVWWWCNEMLEKIEFVSISRVINHMTCYDFEI